MWYAIPIGLLIFIGLDLLIYWKNPQRHDAQNVPLPKVYYPNLRIWGLGLLAGMGVFAAQLFRHATDKLNNEEMLPGVLWPRLAPSVYIIAVLWLLIWGVVRLSRSE